MGFGNNQVMFYGYLKILGPITKFMIATFKTINFKNKNK
jgi:hypothetical protein